MKKIYSLVLIALLMLALLPAAHAEGVVNVYNWED